MRLNACAGCGHPVLEINGQFEWFDSYFLDGDQPPSDSAGAWHIPCLAMSGHGEAWYVALWRNFVEVRGYAELAALVGWSVLRPRRGRELLALARQGGMLSLDFVPDSPRRMRGGVAYRVVTDYHLELDHDSMSVIQAALMDGGTFPLLAVYEMLGIRDRVVHPEVLEDGALQHVPGLGDWSPTSVSTRVSYCVFVPDELVPYVGADVLG